jgi:hypothetical protein
VSDAQNAERVPEPLPDIETPEGVLEVLERAGKGHAEMLPLVRRLFSRDHERGEGLVEVYGNSFAHARDSMINWAAGSDLAIREGMRRKIDALRDELAGPIPTPLERILCELVALCWFDAHETDRRYINQTDISFKAAEYRENRRDRAHKRFLAACKTLATVRKLGLPAIQVNVARQQVNVAGST